MRAGKEYLEDIKKIEPFVYIVGERVKNLVDHPIVKPTLNATAHTFHIAHEILVPPSRVRKEKDKTIKGVLQRKRRN